MSARASRAWGWLAPACLALTYALSVACSPNATLELKDGSRVNGKIVDNRQGHIIVQIDGRAYGVPEERVEDIDHPGDGAFAAAAVLASLATYTLIATAGHCERQEDPGQVACPLVVGLYQTVAVGMLVTAFGFAFHGYATKVESERAVRPRSGREKGARLGPRREVSD